MSSELGVRQIVGCLDEGWLRSLSVRKKSKPWPKVPTAMNFRHHWRRQAAHFLGWKERTNFGEEVNTFLRFDLWPPEAQIDGAITHRLVGSACPGNGGATSNRSCIEVPGFSKETQARPRETHTTVAASGCETVQPSKRICWERPSDGPSCDAVTGLRRGRIGDPDSV